MDKRTEQYFKSILAEEPADYSRLPLFAGSYLGKLRYYLGQFRHINYRESFVNFFTGIKSLGGHMMNVLNKKIEKPKPAAEEAEPAKTAELAKIPAPEAQPLAAQEPPKVEIEPKNQEVNLPAPEKPKEEPQEPKEPRESEKPAPEKPEEKPKRRLRKLRS